MTKINYIEEYYQAILDGREVVGRWIRIWYKMVLDGIASGAWFYDGKKARRVIRFVETMCHHSKGRRDYIKLELWQKAFLSVVFGIVDSRGFRQFREVVLVVARKNGKTLIAACIGDYILICDGEYGAEIYSVPCAGCVRIIVPFFFHCGRAEWRHRHNGPGHPGHYRHKVRV